MLGYDGYFFKVKEFISAYIIDETVTKLALVFENTDSDDLKEILHCLQNHEEFVSINFDDKDDSEVVVILKLPKEHSINFNMFKIGRYTKFDNNFKELLMEIHGRLTGAGKCIMMSDALFPNYQSKKYRADQLGVAISDLPNGETMSIPDMDRELYWKVDELSKMSKHIIKNK